MICPICHKPITPDQEKMSTLYQLSLPLSDYCHLPCRYTLPWIVPLAGVPLAGAPTSTPPPTKSGQLALL